MILLYLGENDEIARAEGYFVHVFVKRNQREEKVKIPNNILKELKKITF